MSDAQVIVFGSINLDLVTRVQSHPVPGETVVGSDYEMLPGGKGANQALAAAQAISTPSKVNMVGCVGNDDFAAHAIGNISRSGMDFSLVKHVSAGTGIAMIAVNESGENSIVVCPGANALAQAIHLSDTAFSRGDILLTQQEVPLAEIWRSHVIAKKSGAIVVHNAAPAASIPATAFQNIDYLIVNASELNSLANGFGLAALDTQSAAACIAVEFDVSVILTLGENGVFSVIEGDQLYKPADSVEVVDTTGAGDVFCGTFAAGLAEGLPPDVAVERSMLAATNACTSFGAQRVVLKVG